MAATPKVYVICDANCKFESLTKEQILTAITQAVNEGTIGDIDTGFVTTIKTINNVPLKFFVGTQDQYLALTDEQKENLYAIITNDTTREGIEKAIEELQTEVDGIKNGLHDGIYLSSGAPVKDGAVKTFTFGNENGFGLADPMVGGFFKLWAHDVFGEGSYYCHLIPSYNNRQMLGWEDSRFRKIYAKDINCNNIEYNKGFTDYNGSKLEVGTYQILATGDNNTYNAIINVDGKGGNIALLGMNNHTICQLYATTDGKLSVQQYLPDGDMYKLIGVGHTWYLDFTIKYRKLW